MLKTPSVRFVCGQRELKGEDVAFAHEEWCIGECVWHLFSVCDGHGGGGAAGFVEQHILDILGPHLPAGDPPPWTTVEGQQWAAKVSEALAVTFIQLDEKFAGKGCSSGTTISVAILCGWLLTVANIGDSDIFIDVGITIEELSECHKVHSNLSEQARLTSVGAVVDSLSQSMLGPPRPNEQGIGPLRAWPGGVAVSRSLGDFDCCHHVIPNPHIRQVVIPASGARLLMASDGLWDFFSGSRACKIIRKARLEKAPARLFRALMFQTDGLLLDDTTIMIVDILPKGTVEFRDAVKEAKKATRQGLVSKVRRAINSLFKDERSRSLEIYSEADSLDAFPALQSSGFSIFDSRKNNIGNPETPKVIANISVKNFDRPQLNDERMVQIHKATENPADIFRDMDDVEEDYCQMCGGIREEGTCVCEEHLKMENSNSAEIWIPSPSQPICTEAL